MSASRRRSFPIARMLGIVLVAIVAGVAWAKPALPPTNCPSPNSASTRIANDLFGLVHYVTIPVLDQARTLRRMSGGVLMNATSLAIFSAANVASNSFGILQNRSIGFLSTVKGLWAQSSLPQTALLSALISIATLSAYVIYRLHRLYRRLTWKSVNRVELRKRVHYANMRRLWDDIRTEDDGSGMIRHWSKRYSAQR